MKYLSLPVHLFKFWYLESFEFFYRALRNLIAYLEEDLAVGLMWRLLLTPLFHDASFLGRLLSFVFRGVRVVTGLMAFGVAFLIVTFTYLSWLVTPALAFYLTGSLGLVFKICLASGVFLFVRHTFSHPHKTLNQIQKLSEIWQCSFIKPDELDYDSLIHDTGILHLLRYLELTPQEMLRVNLGSFSPESLLKNTLEVGKKVGARYLSAPHFFVGYIFSSLEVDKKLMVFNLTKEDFLNCLKFLEVKDQSWRRIYFWDADFHISHLKGTNRGWMGVPTPTLDSVSTDLTKMVSTQKTEGLVGRAEILSSVVHLISGEGKKNVLIVGEVGSGRTTLVDNLAAMILRGNAPVDLATKRLVQIDIAKLVYGVSDQGSLAQRVNDMFEEIKYSSNIILFLDDLESFGMGEMEEKFNLYSLIMPFFDSSGVQIIGTTTNQGLYQISQKNPSLPHTFTIVELPETSRDETLEILKTKAIEAERYQEKIVSFKALKELVELSSHYVHDRVQPDAAISIFNICLKESEEKLIDTKVVERVVQTVIKIPLVEINQSSKNELLNLEDLIHQKVVGQHDAVMVVAQTLRRSAVHIRDNNRPIGSFLFVGPTGVGKTEVAKALAEVYFKNQGQFLRFDMSEFQNEASVERLIGNLNVEGQLTEAVSHNPYSLILLDEFEKADPKILTLFLQVLEDGRLTEGTGKTVDFTNTIIIATSNTGSLLIAQSLADGKKYDQIKAEVFDELLKSFKPELVNRFDEVVVFKPLSNEELQKIVVIKLGTLKKQLQDQGYLIEFDQNLIKSLATRGFDPVLGARPLRRLIQDSLEAKLSEMILRNQLTKGSSLKLDASVIMV